MVPANRPQRRHRLDRADFIISRHDRDEDRVWPQCFLQRIWPNDAFPVHWKHGKLESLFPGQVFTRMENSMMFYSASDQVPSFGLKQSRDSEERQIHALGSTAGKDNFAWFAAQEGCSAVPRIIEERPSLAPDVMDTRRVTPNLAQVGQHGLPRVRIQRSRRVVIEIDGAHYPSFRESPAEAGF